MEEIKKDQEIVITGYITKIIVRKQSGWGIGLFKSDKQDNATIRIKGPILQFKPRVSYSLTGHYENSEKYGKSFDVKFGELHFGDSKKDAINLLSGPTFPGIGKILAERIVDHYEGDVIKQIMLNPQSIYDIEDIPQSKVEIIIDAVKNKLKENELSKEFFENDLKIEFLNHLNSTIDDSKQIKWILENDFYNYAKQNKLQTFYDVDKVVMHFENLDTWNDKRIAWNAFYVVGDILRISGNTYTDLDHVYKNLMNLTGVNEHKTLQDGLVKAKELGLLYFVKGKIYTNESWEDEMLIADIISKKILNQDLHNYDISLINSYIVQIEKELEHELKIKNFKYDESQKDALIKFANSNIFILTGGPGTGKTTVINGMYKLYKYLNSNYNKLTIGIAAPTGRAAARINEIDKDLGAQTIHKLLVADENGEFLYKDDHRLEHNMIILDESSMIENYIFARFLDAAKDVEKIILVGDANQLPSVGYGELFNNLLDIEQIPKSNLQRIHRQSNGNGIIDLAYKVLNGEIKQIDDLKNLNNVETYFDEEYQNIDTIKKIFIDEMNNKDINDVQIITPFYKGDLGIDIINEEVQNIYQYQILNKTDDELKKETMLRGKTKYVKDDKIMYLINEGAIGLSNGDVGIIKDMTIINHKLENAVVEFNGIEKNFYSDNFKYSTLSYACSVHKTQGSEYSDVIFTIEKGQHVNFLSKKLIYTGLTRAKNNLIIVGDFNSFLKGINKETKPRLTTLKEKINDILSI